VKLAMAGIVNETSHPRVSPEDAALVERLSPSARSVRLQPTPCGRADEGPDAPVSSANESVSGLES
jgi:hypothetical protein